MTLRRFVASAALLVLASCSGGSTAGDDARQSRSSASFVGDIRRAAEAVEADLGAPQEFFEITATPQLTNIFVAVDGGTAAIPYVYVDGQLEPPAPQIEGAQGQTFRKDAIDFDESTVLDGIASDLPSAAIDSFSVEGGPDGFVRYVISARSDKGGVLDVVVAPSGAIIEVDPL